MKTIILFVSILCALSNAVAQDPTWNPQQVSHKVKDVYSTESAVILEDERVHEMKSDAKNEMWVYMYNRRLIKVNDDKGVEQYNKVYVYVPYNTEVLEIQARTLQPDGKVVNLPASKIFDEEEDGRQYKKFALEGIEKGSEIEYITRMKKEITTFGLEVYRSGSTPIQKATFTLIVPDHLQFAMKGYNGVMVGNDTVINKKRITKAIAENIEALDEDQYATTSPFSKNVQYKLAYNLDKDRSVRLYTWNELAKNVYNNYNTFNDKELKAIDNFYKQMKLSDNLKEEARIIAIEDYIKSNINTDENVIGEDANKIEKIIKSKVAGNFGFIRLFMGVLAKAGIKNQIVFPSKRDELPIDEHFENYRLIDDMLIYFPATGKFLDPVSAVYRYPHVEPYFAGTRGLFLKGTTIGNFTTALASFDSIPLLPYEENYSNLDVHLRFNAEMDSLVIKSKQSLLGYSAANYRPAYSFLTKDKQDEFTKDIIKTVGNSDKISNIKVENTGMTDGSRNLALHIMGDISTAELTEKAGNKILVKIGEVIGNQVQMYQDKKRHLPIVIQYPHALDRVIRFTIPKGYQVKNLNDLNMNITDKSSGNETMGFISSYKLNGSELEVTLHEFYKEIYYPLSRFEEFRKVINAAADFNKVVLVLEKI